MHAIESAQTAEQSVIGAIILDEKSLNVVIDIIKPEDFYFAELKACYEAILELSRNGKPIDFVTVLARVTADGAHDKAVMKKLLLRCTEITPSIRNIEQFQSYMLDGVSAENVDEVAEKAMSELFEIAKTRTSKKLQNIGNVGLQLFDDYSKNEEDTIRIDTGFTKLDSFLKGMSAGNLIILAARPKAFLLRGLTSSILSEMKAPSNCQGTYYKGARIKGPV